MSELVVIPFSVRNVRDEVIVFLLMFLGWRVYYQVGMSLSAEQVLVIIVQ